MRFCGDGNNLRQPEKRFPLLVQLGFDGAWTDVNKMPLPVSTDGTMTALHDVEQVLTRAMDLPARDRLECAAGLNLSGNINKSFARPLLQAFPDKLRQ